ncbi:uncharacterized protein [Macaca fascicularis]|uniref:uncharacterized protein n=1 Tax=Macaca fascicularis TaxID=9541 RepID=UPI003D15D491
MKDATTSPVQENWSISGSFHNRRASSIGRRGRGPKPWRQRPRDIGRARLRPVRGGGAPGAETPRDAEGEPGPDPLPLRARAARLRPHCFPEVTSSPLLPYPPKYLGSAPLSPPPVTPTPTPTRSRRRPPQAAAEDSRQAANPGGGGGCGPRRTLGRTAAGPRPVPRGSGRRAASGQRLRPARTKRPGAPGRGCAASPGARGAGRMAGALT